MPVALPLILVTVTDQRHSPSSCQSLDQAQRELLAVVLDGPAALVDGPIQEELFSILP